MEDRGWQTAVGIFDPLTRIESTKAAPWTEARSSKQIQMTKKHNVSNKDNSDSEFKIQ